jgi:hypothetical protein
MQNVPCTGQGELTLVSEPGRLLSGTEGWGVLLSFCKQGKFLVGRREENPGPYTARRGVRGKG